MAGADVPTPTQPELALSKAKELQDWDRAKVLPAASWFQGKVRNFPLLLPPNLNSSLPVPNHWDQSMRKEFHEGNYMSSGVICYYNRYPS